MDPAVSAKIIKILIGNIQVNMHDLCSLTLAPKPQAIKEKKPQINLAPSNLKSFCALKDIFNKVKVNPEKGTVYLADLISDKGPVPRICKEHLQLSSKKIY